MLSITGQKYVEVSPWLVVFPSIAVSLAVFGFNLLGDALRDVLDPKLKGEQSLFFKMAKIGHASEE